MMKILLLLQKQKNDYSQQFYQKNGDENLKRRLISTIPTKRVIGILGTAPGMGVTHFALSLGNYLEAKYAKNVAIVECNQNQTFQYLKRNAPTLCIEKSREADFAILGVDYYMNVEEERLISILNQGYEYYLIDFGSDYDTARRELTRCDKKLLLGSICEWRKQEADYILEKIEEMDVVINWEFLATFGMKEDKKEFRRKWQMPIKSYPYIENPFQIQREQFQFLEQFV